MNGVQIDKSIIIPITLTTVAAGDSFQFRASSKMKGKRVTHIAVVTEAETLKFNGLTPVAANALPSLQLTFLAEGNSNMLIIDSLPATQLQLNQATDNRGYTPFNGDNVDFETSKVNVVSGTNLTAGEVFLLLCIYE